MIRICMRSAHLVLSSKFNCLPLPRELSVISAHAALNKHARLFSHNVSKDLLSEIHNITGGPPSMRLEKVYPNSGHDTASTAKTGMITDQGKPRQGNDCIV